MLSGKLQKLRSLILHESTPAGERRAALARLESALSPDVPTSSVQASITRSTRIGHRRRKTVIDEFARLDLYTPDTTYGDTIRDIHAACRACRSFPTGIDFGYHDSDEAVVAVRFKAGSVPDPMALQEEMRSYWPGMRITLTTQDEDVERTLLFYLGVHQRDAEETELHEAD